MVTLNRETFTVTGLVYDEVTNQPIQDVEIKLGPLETNNNYLSDTSKSDGSFVIPKHQYSVKVKASRNFHEPLPSPIVLFLHKNYKTTNKSFSEFSFLDREISNVENKHYNMEKRILNMKKVYLTPKTTKD